MRQFYEEWRPYVNRQPLAGDLDWKEFLTISFSHHMEIISKAKDYDERIFYIHQCAIHAWSKFTLRDYIKSDLYHNIDSLPNNFDLALPSSQYAIKATKAFKENYLLDFINIEAGKFRPSYLGQMTTYLTVLDDTVRKPHENPSIGLILCRDMNKAFVDYVIRDYAKPLGVATYRTTKDMSEKMKNALPDPEELKRLVLAQDVEDKR